MMREEKNHQAIKSGIHDLMKRENFQEVRTSSFKKNEIDKMTIIKAKLIPTFLDSVTPNERKKA